MRKSVHIKPADYATGDDERDIERATAAMIDAVEAEKKRSRRNVVPESCESCGSGDVIPIVYGLPISAMFRAYADGKIMLGGNPFAGAPTVQCRMCGTRSGMLAI